ncbi:aa3-type cytochrome c oxidase subunit IV, partial [bacterium M00.F.Ca.ET.227.01.1.1]
FFVGGFFSAVILWAVILAAGFFILR